MITEKCPQYYYPEKNYHDITITIPTLSIATSQLGKALHIFCVYCSLMICYRMMEWKILVRLVHQLTSWLHLEVIILAANAYNPLIKTKSISLVFVKVTRINSLC